MKIDSSVTPKEMFWDILEMKDSLLYFLNKGKGYDDLITFLQDQKYFENQDTPSIKELLKETGLTYSKLSKKLKDLHDNLRTDDDFVIKSDGIRYRFYVKSRLIQYYFQ